VQSIRYIASIKPYLHNLGLPCYFNPTATPIIPLGLRLGATLGRKRSILFLVKAQKASIPAYAFELFPSTHATIRIKPTMATA
jgi:hypothetical protein